MANNENIGCPESILPITSITDLPQAYNFSQNSHNNVKFINVNSVGKYDDQTEKDQPIKSKNLNICDGIAWYVPLC